MVGNPVFIQQAAENNNILEKKKTQHHSFVEDFNSRQYRSFEAEIEPEHKLVNLLNKTISESDNSLLDVRQLRDPHFADQKF